MTEPLLLTIIVFLHKFAQLYFSLELVLMHDHLNFEREKR